MALWIDIKHVSSQKKLLPIHSIDYFKNFSHAARLNSIHILFSLVNMDWMMFQIDVKNTFLYRDLHAEVYLEQISGYATDGKNVVCKLKKAIYGLMQNP